MNSEPLEAYHLSNTWRFIMVCARRSLDWQPLGRGETVTQRGFSRKILQKWVALGSYGNFFAAGCIWDFPEPWYDALLQRCCG